MDMDIVDLPMKNGICSIVIWIIYGLPSGKYTKNYGTSPFIAGQINYFNGNFQ